MLGAIKRLAAVDAAGEATYSPSWNG